MFHSSLIFTLFCLIQNIHCEPERKPTALPVIPPSREPTAAPSTRSPSHTPSVRPTKTPVTPPTKTPTIQPSPIPSVEPTHSQLPSPLPTSRPSGSPTSTPSMQPSRQPTSQPSRQPTSQPSTSPSRPTIQPTPQPTLTPKPTPRPSFKPSFKPTTTPQPSVFRFPTSQPSGQPSSQPFARPSGQPTCQPSMRPTAPTGQPSSSPSCQPSSQPSRQPSSQPTTQPSSPTGQPSSQPSLRPTTTPSQCPTGQPSVTPTCTPSNSPTVYPTLTHRPTSQPSMQPTGSPTEMPSSRPSGSPTQTHKPTKRPSSQPTGQPSIQPSMQPTGQPSSQPTFMPTMPTGQPTGQPSRQPSTQPTGQPSKQPTCQPSGQPSSQPTWGPTSPTGQPTTQPSLQPSNQPTSSPTCTQRPSSQPSSSPSMIPSSQPVSSPTSFPTDFHRPTSKPTGKSKPFPTSTPTWSSGAFTESPTGLYQNLGVTGSVVFNPENSTACTPVEIHIRLQFNRNIDAGSIFWITAPGLTSGPCGTTSNGPDKGDVYIPNVDGFSGSYVEGDYRDNYASSRFKFVIDSSDVLTGDDGMYLVIDRNNLFRRTCTYNNSWIVTVQPLGRTSGVSGFIDRVDTYPQRCTTFYSALAFSTPMQQFPTAINVSMHFGYIMMEGSEVTIRLPGFTNKKGGFQLNDMVANSSDFIGRGQDAELYNLTWSTNYTWTGRYYEGDPYDKYRDSRIVLRSYGNQLTVVPFWVKIGEQNYLIPTCGNMINSTGFTIAAVDQYSFTAERPVDGSNAIGRGCSDLNDCSNHGQCDYCQSKCRCDDGFGSARDRLFTSSGDFLPDCSSRACPIGPSIGSLLQSTNGTDRNNTQMHGMYECSNNGKCQRSSGLCQCNPGYYGAACQKMSCHNRCSDRGQCMSMKRLATSLEAFPLSDLVVHYESFNNSHYDKSWDGDFGHTCVCDSSWPVGLGADETQASEFFGPFCQYRHCPSGDDPVTPIDETDCEGKAKTNHLKTRHTIGQPGNKCHVDCSNRGICDFSSGICKCFEGYGGNNCGTRLSFMKSTGGVTKHSRQ